LGCETPGQIRAGSGEHTITDLAGIFPLSRATVYRVLERARDIS
jgi:hypothetical protein